jgi:subtilisin family serine protease
MKQMSALLGILVIALAVTASAENTMRVPMQPSSDLVRWVDDEFIVEFTSDVRGNLETKTDRLGRPTANVASVQRLLDLNGVEQFRREFPNAHPLTAGARGTDLTGYYKVKLLPGADLDAAMADFEASPNVDHVEKIGIHRMYLEPNDTYYDNPPPSFPHNAWHIKQSADHDIDGNLAWDTETGDATVVVGVMDSGVRYYHFDLGGPNPPGPDDNSTNGNIWVNAEETPNNGIDDDGNGYVDDVIGYDFVNTSGPDRCASNQGEDCNTPDNDPRDFNGHGTSVAGCIAAITNNAAGVVGVAGGYSDGTTSGAGNGVKIMCLRIGWQARDGYGYVRMDFAAEAINYAVQKKLDGYNIAALNCSWGTSNSGGLGAAADNALANDIMLIHAAGNSGNSSADFFGSKAGIMNVAATDSNDARASFSNYGSWVDVAAPGVDIITTYHYNQDPANDYVVVTSGTSFSSPITCGVAALLESLDPGLSGPDKFNIIVTSGDNIGNQQIGLRLNAKNALDAVSPCVDAAPPSVTVTAPDGGEDWEINSTHAITWSASDDCGIDATEIRLDRGNDGTYEEQIALLSGNPGSYDWTVTGPSGGSNRIQVIVTDGASNSTSDASNGTFTISQATQPELHVSNVVVTRYSQGPWWRGQAVVTIVDQNNAPVANATVTGDFTGPTNGSPSELTDGSGQATLVSDRTRPEPGGEWCFEVTNVSATGATYNSGANVVTQACESGPVFSDGSPTMIATNDVVTHSEIYPNPFNAGANISFTLREGGDVQLAIYNVLGRKVRHLADGYYSEGTHTVQFDGTDDRGRELASGMYFYRLKTIGFVESRKMLLLK